MMRTRSTRYLALGILHCSNELQMFQLQEYIQLGIWEGISHVIISPFNFDIRNQ